MFYTIYQITNIINNKIYIGKHQTMNLDDEYMGSGKLLKAAIKKYGIENFKKELLYIFDSEFEMNVKEKELVTEEFCDRDDTYNLCVGGQGGFGHINKSDIRNGTENTMKITEYRLIFIDALKRGRDTQKKLKEENGEWAKRNREARSLAAKKRNAGSGNPFFGKKHSEETLAKLRKSKNKGKNNSQFGSIWITNGHVNKKIKKTDIIPPGWNKGRIIKKFE